MQKAVLTNVTTMANVPDIFNVVLKKTEVFHELEKSVVAEARGSNFLRRGVWGVDLSVELSVATAIPNEHDQKGVNPLGLERINISMINVMKSSNFYVNDYIIFMGSSLECKLTLFGDFFVITVFYFLSLPN